MAAMSTNQCFSSVYIILQVLSNMDILLNTLLHLLQLGFCIESWMKLGCRIAVFRSFAVLTFCTHLHSSCFCFRQQFLMIFNSGLWAGHSIFGILSCSINSFKDLALWTHCHLETCNHSVNVNYFYIFLGIYIPIIYNT